MQALFGAGHHPLATQRAEALDSRSVRDGTIPSESKYKAAMRLGGKPPVSDSRTR